MPSLVLKNAVCGPYFASSRGTSSKMNCCVPGRPPSPVGSGAETKWNWMPRLAHSLIMMSRRRDSSTIDMWRGNE